MALFSRKPKPFRWTEDEKARFDKGFRAKRDGEGPLRNLEAIITQRMDRRHAWDLEVETEYYGWVANNWNYSSSGVSRVPFLLNVNRTDDEYGKRDSRNRSALPPIGDCYFWEKGQGEASDGFQVVLYLDGRRHRAFTQAIRAHGSQAAPTLSLLLARVPEEEKMSTSTDKVRVQAYWLNTVPLDVGGYLKHPYARTAFD